MGQNAQTSVLTHSTGLDAGVFLFTFLVLAYAAYLIWAIYHREDDIDREIRAAINYPAEQAKKADAIKGRK